MIDPIKTIQEETNLSVRTQQALGYALPPIVPLQTLVRATDEPRDTFTDPVVEAKAGRNDVKTLVTDMIVPVTLRLQSESREEGFLIPIDPQVSVSGKNILVRRRPAKSTRRGTIKERWTQDDWQVTISGVLMSDDTMKVGEYVRELKRYLDAAESIDIVCDPLNNDYEITKVSVEDYDFPFTPGEENQAFVIKMWSDDVFQLLVKI